jgi:hypothetical protein
MKYFPLILCIALQACDANVNVTATMPSPSVTKVAPADMASPLPEPTKEPSPEPSAEPEPSPTVSATPVARQPIEYALVAQQYYNPTVYYPSRTKSFYGEVVIPQTLAFEHGSAINTVVYLELGQNECMYHDGEFYMCVSGAQAGDTIVVNGRVSLTLAAPEYSDTFIRVRYSMLLYPL